MKGIVKHKVPPMRPMLAISPLRDYGARNLQGFSPWSSPYAVRFVVPRGATGVGAPALLAAEVGAWSRRTWASPDWLFTLLRALRRFVPETAKPNRWSPKKCQAWFYL